MHRVLLALALSATTLGCGNDDGDDKARADGGSSSGPRGGSTMGSATADGAPHSAADADVGWPTDSGHVSRDAGAISVCPSPSILANTACSAAEIAGFSQCIDTACKSKYEECYGTDYETGSFGGPCADYLACNSKCPCDDTACTAACQVSEACSTCQSGFSACASPCIAQLSCAMRGRGAAGVLVPDASAQ